MAERRMFSKRIVGSARFLRMPISTQALYFHLGLHADDDGIVEAYTVIKSVGCTEDDLRVLVSKGFIKVLNDDLVSYITDWMENNKVRADRKIDSIYKDLLLQIVPDAPMLERKRRADTGQPADGQVTTNGQPMDNQRTDNGQPMDGIGKVRIGKDSNNIYIGEFFEEIWRLYPIKKGKGQVSQTKKKYLYQHVGLDQMKRCIERYTEDMKSSERDKKFWMHGSTFLNSGYVDYLDENYGYDESSPKVDVFSEPQRGIDGDILE